tara:strand:- start:4563 stop:4868 length:306 start_codon:yes stop_codon:yes gene_type:complete
MINFVDLVPGNRFVHDNKSYMKLAHEVCDFWSLGGGYDLRLNIETEDGIPAVARAAIIYNSVNLDTGEIKSFQSQDLVEADLENQTETPNIQSSDIQSYTF